MSKFSVPCCDVRCDFHIKRCSVRLCHQLFVGELMSYCVLCVYLRILMSNRKLLLIFLVFCFVCLRPVSYVPTVADFSGLSILDFPFGFSNVYLAYKNSVSDWL